MLNFLLQFETIREEKEDVNHSIEPTPQSTPIPTNTNAPSQTPNSEHQPEVDEDGYCIQPKDPLWNAQWNKKGMQMYFESILNNCDYEQSFYSFFRRR